jgi:hypothetical protein
MYPPKTIIYRGLTEDTCLDFFEAATHLEAEQFICDHRNHILDTFGKSTSKNQYRIINIPVELNTLYEVQSSSE